ncbi:uncharacterized protein F4822DRAFT_63227 [Hypoxylon trugodes]|uniref:uncharacterized protein n=1 Tax=Hypoxylon trugodes TaxID=326681 RepID=UPI002196D2FA|nr:uncharacterized protein F4822DRAFT_63227 [Hypoxylon trugodes]KAI1384196.1 hypothetical protein F4822DRAFT_63227 [Hypoxylon trugodes]
MDSSTSIRGRSRKRHTLTTMSSNPSTEPTEQSSSATQAASMASSSFTFETPSPSASRDARARTRQVDGPSTIASPEDLTSKGGRSLRKRPRVDYTFDQLDDIENAAKTTPSTTSRALKRRKTDVASNESDVDEDIPEVQIKRRASEQPQPSSARRRNTRKSTAEPQAFVPQHQMDDVEVQDTIEVGGHHSSESDESALRRTDSSSTNESKQEPQPNPEDKLKTRVQVNGNICGATKSQEQDEAHNPEETIPALSNGVAKMDSLEHLTPYIEGAYVCYPQFDELEQDIEPIPEPEQKPTPKSSTEVDTQADSQGNVETTINGDADRELYPEPEPNEINQGSIEEAATETETVIPKQPESAVETPADTTVNTPPAEAESSNIQPPENGQYSFKQTRPASEFIDLFKDIKSLSPEELYYRAQTANNALSAWQEEFKELRKITDDYDNSVRYHKEEEAFQRKFDLAVSKNPTANPERKDFVVKGSRAPAPNAEEAEIAYHKQQDRIMANVYGFEYDHRMDKLGNQDPIAQRTGLGRQGRLRERPKQTAKAAEAEEPTVVQGKRTRKAPERFNGGETTSRGSTPAPTRSRVRRGGQVQENDQNQAQENQDTTSANLAPTANENEAPRKKGKGGRPRKNPLPVSVPEAEPTPTEEQEPDEEFNPQPEPESDFQQKAPPKTPRSRAKAGAKAQLKIESPTQPKSSPKRAAEPDEEEEQPSRKRRRRGPAPSSVPAATDADIEEEDSALNGREAETPAKLGRQRNPKKPAVASISFNSTSTIPSPAPAEEPRPHTASSTATAETVASTSNYQLREKRQRKFTNDVNDDDFMDAPKPKRARRAPKKTQGKAEAAMSAPEPAPESEEPTRKIIKLKLWSKGKSIPPPAPAPTSTPLAPPIVKTPANASSSVSGNPNGIVVDAGVSEPTASNGEAGDPSKDYNSMTKSEKMSFSMKARWKSGSMGSAVEKRRATLAAKKQALGPVPQPSSTLDEGEDEDTTARQ